MDFVYFSGPSDEPYGHLATNYICPISIQSEVFPSVAHFMLCAQCQNPVFREEIRLTPDYNKAKQYFLSRRIQRKPLLELKALLEGIMQKYIQHPDLAKKLMDTTGTIICGSKDKIYGVGLTKEEVEKHVPFRGKNQLGISLMKARDILQKEKK